MIYSWQTVNCGNLAEQVCRPTEYFDLGQEVEVLDQECPDEAFHQGPVIFGASGLLYPEIAPRLEKAVKSKSHPMIAWGIGHNTHYGKTIEYPDWLNSFDLVGLRDWGTRWDYVPCPSCMSSVFDVSYGIPPNRLVVYDQIDYPVKLELNGIPRENNFHPAEDLPKIVSFLASGETILTSSYHGAYWGRLLNRKVLVWEPWSTKFHTFKPPYLTFVNAETWEKSVDLPQDHRGYLYECRTRNRHFADRVKLVLNPNRL